MRRSIHETGLVEQVILAKTAARKRLRDHLKGESRSVFTYDANSPPSVEKVMEDQAYADLLSSYCMKIDSEIRDLGQSDD